MDQNRKLEPKSETRRSKNKAEVSIEFEKTGIANDSFCEFTIPKDFGKSIKTIHFF